METHLKQVTREALERNLPAADILSLICREAENLLPQAHVCVLGVKGGGRLAPLSQPSLPPTFTRALQNYRLRPEITATGMAILSGRPVVADEAVIAKCPDPAVREAFRRTGIKSCRSMPVKAGESKVVGAVTFYCRERLDDENFVNRLARLTADLCAAVLKRDDADPARGPLTRFEEMAGLPNRDYLVLSAERMLERARRSGRPLGVLVVSLDRLPMVNDARRLERADRLFRMMALEIRDQRPDQDRLVGRLFSNGLAVVLGDCDFSGALEAARDVQRIVAKTGRLERFRAALTASVGVSLYPANGLDVAILLHNASLAMTEARGEGHGRTRFYCAEQNEQAARALALESALRQALGHSEMSLSYQPQVDLRRGRLYGVEAFMRWSSPVFKQVPPEHFLSIAEKSGEISRLNRWVLAEAIGQLGRWRRRGLRLPSVSVNISPACLHDGDLLSLILDNLRANNLTAGDLRLELTEAAFVNSEGRIGAVIDEAHRVGVRFCVADFGSGYSRLSLLHWLPVCQLKLDRSFVHDFEENESSRRISRAIAGIGRSLGLDLVAEGVETQKQLNILRKQGWHAVQGFYFSPALPGEEFERWLASFSAYGGRAAWPAARSGSGSGAGRESPVYSACAG